jgi:hypothetical protein
MRHLSIITRGALATAVATAVTTLISGCESPPLPPEGYAQSAPQQYTQYSTEAPPPDAAYPYPDQSFDSVYIDPPLDQPPPVRIDWAPPPMLDEEISPQPYPDAVWIGGYWVWQDNWVWARGRWSGPPRRDYRWVRPYYEHRGDSVIFIGGFWAAPGVSFHRPSPNIDIPLARVRPGVIRGPRPVGPEGAFLPPPHGSRRGEIRPAQAPQPQAPQQQRIRAPEQDQGRMPPSAPGTGMRAPADMNAVPSPVHPNDAGPGPRDRVQVRPSANTMPPPERQHPPRPQQQVIVPGAPQAPRDGGQEAVQRAREAQQHLSQPQAQPLRPPHPQPQIEQFAPPHAPPPRVSPPPAARPPAQNSGGDRHDEQGGQGHDKHDRHE